SQVLDVDLPPAQHAREVLVVFVEPSLGLAVLTGDQLVAEFERCSHALGLLGPLAPLAYLRNPSCNPPSTGITCPVVFARRCETSRKMASAWSSGSIGDCVSARFA